MRNLLAFATVIALSATARAGTHEVSIGSTTRAVRSDSANALTGDSLDGGALAYAHALPFELLPGLHAWGQATFGWGGADGSMFQTLSTEIDSLAFTVGGRARYALHPRVIASGRFELGMARAAVTIRDDSDYTATDAGWAPMSEASVALDLLAIRARRVALGLRFELGVVAAVPIGLAPRPDSASDGTLQLEMSTSGLGSLNLSGASFAFAVVSQF